MKNYKIRIQYDGTRYKGWQVQKNDDNTIQGKIQKVLESLTNEPVELIGSGRTDAGVHALGQIANFHINENKAFEGLIQKGLIRTEPIQKGLIRTEPIQKGLIRTEPIQNASIQKVTIQKKTAPQKFTPAASIPCGNLPILLKTYLNRYLPEDIAVLEVTEVPELFHARYSAERKTYRYRIHVSDVPNVFERKYVYTYLDMPLDVEKMKKAADMLCGTHDYMSFCGNKHMKKSTIRTIERIDICEITDTDGLRKEIRLDYTGDGFLQNMIRILTGTLIEIGSGRRKADEIPEILAAKDRSKAGYTVPAQGLTLLNVEYSNSNNRK